MLNVKRSGSSKRQGRRLRLAQPVLILATAGVAGLYHPAPVHAQNNIWSFTGPAGSANAPITGSWNASSNWAFVSGTNSSTGIPTSAAGTELDFGGSGATAYTATNNISSSTFTLNAIKFNSSASVSNTILNNSNNTLTFSSNGSVGPSILQNNTGAFNLASGIILSNDLLIGGTGSGAVTFSGSFSGTNTIAFNGSNTTTLAGNSSGYSGTIIINSGTVIGTNGAATGGLASGSFGANGNTVIVNSGATVEGTVARSVLGGNLSTRMLVLNGGTYWANFAATGSDYLWNINMTGGTVTSPAGFYIRTSQGASGGNINSLAASTQSVFNSGIDMTWNSLTFNVAKGTVANGAADFVLNGALTQDNGAGSGAKSLTKTGLGTMSWTGTGLYQGGTFINQGTLVFSGTTVGASNATAGVSVAGGATMSTADGVFQTLTLSAPSNVTALTLGDGGSTRANLVMDLGDSITTPGLVAIANSGVNITLNSSASNMPLGGQSTLITASGGYSASTAPTLTNSSMDGYSVSLTSDATHLYLSESAAPASAYWNGTTNSSWSYFNNSNGTSNWTNSSGGELGQTPGAASDVFMTNTTVGTGGLSTTLNANFSINSLTFTGSGTAATSSVTIAGPGTLTLLAGSSASGGAGYAAGTGIVVAAGSGAHTIGANIALGGAQTWTNNSTNPLAISGNISGGSTFALNLSGGTFTFSGNNTYTGITNVSAGMLNYTGTANSSGAGLFLVGGPNGAVLNMASTGTISLANSSYIGNQSSGAVVQTAGTVSFGPSGYLFLSGPGVNTSSYGSYTLTGGTLNGATGGGLVIGNDGLASFVMTGGTLNLARVMYIGDGTSNNSFSTGQGVATFTGGSITQTVNYIDFSSNTNTGWGGAMNLGTLAGGSATFVNTVAGLSGGIKFNTSNAPMGSSLNLNHGTLQISGGMIQAGTPLAPATINFNGALLKAGGTASTYNLIDASLGNSAATVYPGGANIDVTGTNVVYINTTLNGATGNGVYAGTTGGAFGIASGGGTGYIGAPLVSVSGGSGTGLQAVANISNGVVSGVVLTNPGQNYQVGDTVSFSFSGGGTSNPASTYNYTLTSADIASNSGGSLTKSDTGTLVLNGSSTYTGPTNITGGTLQLGNASTGTIPNTTVNISSGALLAFGRTDTALVLPNTIIGAGGLSQTGAGTTKLTGSLAYTGPTNISAGRLVVTSPLSNTAINISGGTFNPQISTGTTYTIGSGSASLAIKGGGTLDLTDGVIGTYNLAGNASSTSLTLGSSTGTAVLNFEVGSNAVDQLAVTGSAAVVGATKLNVSTSAYSIVGGNYTIITAAGGLNSSSMSLGLPVLTAGNGALYDLSLANSTSTAEVLTVTQDASSVGIEYWSGAHNGNWNYTSSSNGSAGQTNWQTDASSGIDAGYGPSGITNVFFTANSGSNSNLATTLASNTSINSLNFIGTASGPISISGNTLTINANAFAGNAAGNGINLSGGSSSVTIASNVLLGGPQTWTNNASQFTVTGGLNLSSNTLTITGSGPVSLNGNISAGATLTLNNSGSLGIGGNVNTSAPLVLSNSGPVTINGNISSASSITASGSSSVNISGNINTSGPITASGTGSVNITGIISGTTPVNASGGATLTLAGSNSFSGGVNLSGATLDIASASALGSGPLTITSASTLDNTSGMPLTVANAANLSGNVTFVGSNPLTFSNSTLTLGGGFFITRSINVSSGTLSIGGTVTDGGNFITLNTPGAGTLNLNGPVGGSVSFTASGTGTVNFAGANNYSGSSTFSGGTTNYIGPAGSSGTGAWSIGGTNGATVNLNSTGSFTLYTSPSVAVGLSIGTSLNSAGSLVQNSGTATFNDFNSSSGSYVFLGSSTGSYGSYTLNGGSLSNSPNQSTGIVVGYGSGTASFVMTGGSLNLSRAFYIGDGTSASTPAQGVATFTGGTTTVVSQPGFSANDGIQFGSNFGLGNGGTFNLGTLAGGNAVYTNTSGNGIGGIKFNLSASSNDSLNIDHGTISLAAPIIANSTLFTSETINLNGGILQATGSFNLLDSSLPTTSVVVYNGGANFDVTAGNVATLAANLNSAAGNGVFGQNSTGIINVPTGSGGAGYIGAPLVAVTGGSGSGAQAVANISGGTVTGVVFTNPGQNYQVGDTLNFSFAGGGASSAANYSYTLTAADIQNVSGGGLTKTNTGTLVLNPTYAANSYTGPTLVKNGTLSVIGSGALPVGTNLSIGSIATPASVIVSNVSGSGITVIQINSLSLSGATNSWTGKLDLTNGVAVIHTGDATKITNQLQQGYSNGTWQGSGGIVSSIAAADPTHLTAVGLLVNNDGMGNPIYSSSNQLDQTSPQLNDILLKYTYYGDADLSGTVDSSDYTRIDNGFLLHLTGWGNGDFNYDGIVNGSDYTLIDNAFNTQGASLAAGIAAPTAQFAGESTATAVPEPASIGLLTMAAVGMLGRRSRRRRSGR